MKRVDLLGQDNLDLINRVFAGTNQTILFHSSDFSEIELAFELVKDKIISDKSELYVIEPDDKNKIKIEAVRQLLDQTVISPRTKRYFLIFAADTMQTGAQNALLKELEEPGKNRFFFLFSKQINLLLPTVRSRCQKVNLADISIDTLKKHFAATHPQIPTSQLNQIAFIAGRSVTKWQSLLDDPKEFARSSQLAGLAKQIISAPLYRKLAIIHQVATTREQAIEFVNLVLTIQAHLLSYQITPNIIISTNKWLKSLDLLQHNSSLKLGLLVAVV